MKNLFITIVAVIFAIAFADDSVARDPALDLLVKKGIVSEEEVAAAEAKAKKVSVMTKAHTLELSGYIQPRYYIYDNDSGKDDSFKMKRVRLKVKGYVAPKFLANIQYDFASPKLVDAFVTYEADDMAHMTMGQFSLPYCYAEITSSSKLDTIDRAEVTGELANDYGIGAKVTGEFADGMVEYGAAIINGNGPNQTDDNDKKDIIGRLAVYPFVNSEGSIDLMLAGAFWTGKQPMTATVVDPETGQETEADLGDQDRTRYVGTIKLETGNLKLQGEYLHQDLEEDDVTSDGYYVLVTYDFDVNGTIIQPVVMYDEFDPDTDTNDDEIKTATLGVSVHFTGKKHRSKVSLNYKMIDEEPEKDNDVIVAQWQHKF